MSIKKPSILTREERIRYESQLVAEASHPEPGLIYRQAESIVNLLPEELPTKMAFLLEIVTRSIYSNANPHLQKQIEPYQWAVRLQAPNTDKQFYIETVSEFYVIRDMLDMLRSM